MMPTLTFAACTGAARPSASAAIATEVSSLIVSSRQAFALWFAPHAEAPLPPHAPFIASMAIVGIPTETRAERDKSRMSLYFRRRAGPIHTTGADRTEGTQCRRR